MKLEVIECSTGKMIEAYSVPELSMLDFQEWKESPQTISLNKLSGRVSQLDSRDPETKEPIISHPEVDFYLPDPLKNRAFFLFIESQMDVEESSDQSVDGLNQVTVRSSTILSAVVEEILQNHPTHDDYKVRISDG